MKEKNNIKWLNILIMTFTSLEKYVHSKKSLKQRRQFNPTPHTPLPQPPPLRLAKSKVFSRRKGHLATAVIGDRLAPIPDKVCYWLGKQ